MIKYFTFGIAISVISWMVGMIFNSLLMKTEYYKRVSNLNFITSRTVNTVLGIEYFKWIVKNTFFRFFNQKIKFENKKTDLTEIRREMTIAEVSHLIAFIFVTFVAVYKSAVDSYVLGLIIMLINILMNLYPSLLQQENKRRLDKLINKKEKGLSGYAV